MSNYDEASVLKVLDKVSRSVVNVSTIKLLHHGPQLLIEAEVVKGKKATCYVSVFTDLKNAGGIYLNRSVVVDGNLVTSPVPSGPSKLLPRNPKTSRKKGVYQPNSVSWHDIRANE